MKWREKNNMRTVRELKHTCNTFFLHAFQPSRQKQTAFFHILTFFCCHALRSCIHRNMFPLAAPVSRCYKPLPPPHHHPLHPTSRQVRIIVCVPALLCFYAVCSSETKSRAALEGRGGGERRPTTASSKVLQTHKQATVSERRSHTHIHFVNGTRAANS